MKQPKNKFLPKDFTKILKEIRKCSYVDRLKRLGIIKKT